MLARTIARQIVIALLALTSSLSFAYTLVDTNPSWDGSSGISPFGNPNTATYGQIVTVPAGESSLTGFSFQINDGGTAFPLRGEVYAWDSVNSRATGAALYESPVTSTAGVNGFRALSFTPSIAVAAGQQYVIFATVSRDPAVGTSTWGLLANNTAYPGGQMVFLNNGANVALWLTSSWALVPLDLAFTVQFGVLSAIAPVPTLSQWMLMLLSVLMAGTVFVVMRRQIR
ncbi:MAG: IPTL-CTERM sorting domain-containing protein [Ramlibacter sp.]